MIFYIVDSFTSKPFSGNPAAIFLLEKEISDELKQKIANEINLSETAFVLQQDQNFILRWFTPTKEAGLCGHATLAAAHMLWETGVLNKDEEAVFETRSGILKARKNNDLVEMDFPVEAPFEVECPEGLLKAIDAKPIFVGKNRIDYLAVYESDEFIKKVNPDYGYLKKLDCRGLIISAKSTSDKYDFVSRFFAPNSGIDEDPVTGSAHCCLSPYWSNVFGRKELTGYQASPRGGIVHTKLENDKVVLSGNALTVMKSEIYI